MSTSVGSIHYDLGLDTSKFDAASANTSAKLDSFGGKMAGAFGTFAKVAGAAMVAGGVAIGALTTKMLMAGAELEQQLGGAEAVFGQYADTIKAKAKDAYSSAGLSQAEFLQGANKMGSLFQGAGFTVEQSMNMSAESMQRASDIASIMGIETTAALEAVSGMAKGNFTMMDNLGVAMNDTAIGAYALSKGINKTTAEMSIQEKVGLAQQMFMEKTAKYAGNYAKENDTLAGSLNTTKKAFDNLMSGQGDVGTFIDSLLNTIEIAVPQIITILPKIVDGIGQLLAAIVPALASAIPTILPMFLNTITSLLNALVAAFPSVVNVLLGALPSLIDGFIKLFLAIVVALPKIITTIAQAMPTIINALVNGLTNPTALQALILGAIQLLIAIVNAIPIIIPALINAIPLIIKNLVAALTSAPFQTALVMATLQLMKSIVKGIIDSVIGIGQAAQNIGRTLAQILSPASMANIGNNMIQGLINGIQASAGRVVQIMREIAASAIGAVKKFLGIRSPSRAFMGIGENMGLGLVEGIDSTIGTVQNSLQALTTPPVNVSPVQSAQMAQGMVGSQQQVPSSTNSTINIGTISIDSEQTADYFFAKMSKNQELSGKALTTLAGSIG